MPGEDGNPFPNAWLRRPDERPGCPIADVKAKLRGAGLRPTRQRICLGWLLFGKGHRHVTAEELYTEANAACFRLTVATVYNTLHQFTEAGLLRQLALESAKTIFDTDTTDHHHFYLQEEGRVIDMPSEGVTVTDLPPPPPGMEIAGVEVLVRLRKARVVRPDEAKPHA